MFRSYFRGVAVSVLLSLPAAQAVSASDIAVAARLDSDWFYNGVSESRGEPTIGASIDWQVSEHVFIGAHGHEVLEDDLPITRAIGAFAGFGLPINDSWYLTSTVNQRWFPGSLADWDYLELQSAVHWSPTVADRLRLNLSFSEDFYNSDVRSLFVEASYHHEFSERFYAHLTAGAGRSSDDTAWPNYEHLQLGVGYRIANFSFDLSWRANSEGNDTRVVFGRLQSPSLVGQVVWRIW